MTNEEARRANVETVRRVVDLSSTLGVSRLVHVSGYRVGVRPGQCAVVVAPHQPPSTSVWVPTRPPKVESDAVVQAAAHELGGPLTIVNPSTVMATPSPASPTKPFDLATTVLDLIARQTRGHPRAAQSVFVPVVTVDYLTPFMTLIPALEETPGLGVLGPRSRHPTAA